MKTYKVTLFSGDENVKVDVTAKDQNAAVKVVKTHYAGKEGVTSYTIQEVAPTVNSQAMMVELAGPTSALFAVLLMALVADYKIKKWLKG